MTWIFGDGFDLYAAVADTALGYWDSLSSSGTSFQAGRFGGQSFQMFSNVNPILTKSSGTNDAVHHINVAFHQSSVAGSANSISFQLLDGTTGQCVILFHSDGSITLQSGTVAGATLATYSGAMPAPTLWYSFEFEVVINNTTGSFTVRKNGNTSADFTATGLNTRPGANSYANKLVVGCNSGTPTQQIDDFLWRSDASSVAWVGDIRCYTRMPASDASTQFSRSPSPSVITVVVTTFASDATGTSRYQPFTPSYTGTVGTIVVNFNTAFTGNCKMAIFSDSTGPASVLGSATNVVNPLIGNNTFTFGTPVAVTKGVTYWFGISHDVTALVGTAGTTGARTSSSISYASFPSAGPSTTASQQYIGSSVNITPTVNTEFVNEAQQDGTSTYVYDSTVNDVDFYNIAAASSTPASVVAVTTRGLMQKSDAGTRTGTIQLKSGATTVAATTVSLASGFLWAWRTDTVDPNTSSTWTTGNVDTVTIGPKVIS